MALTTTTYSTYTAILTMLPNLPQSATTTSEVYTTTAQLVCQHLIRAYNLINAKLAKKYAVPFATSNIPPLCATLNEDIACYYTMRSLYTRDAQNNSEWVVEHYDKAIKTLDEIAECKINLIDASDVLIADRVSASNKIQTSTPYAPVFELDEETDWQVDSTRLEDVETARDA